MAKKRHYKKASNLPPRKASQKSGERASSSAATQTDKSRSKQRSWWKIHGQDLRFIGLFVLFLGLFYILAVTEYTQKDLFPSYLRLNARLSGIILNTVGQSVEVRDNTIVGQETFALMIERGCDAVQPSALFCAAVLASPVAFRSRLLAVLLGTGLLMSLNFVRILSLYFIGAYWRSAFDVMHLDVWQALFIIFSIVLWGLWASWATRRERKVKQHATTA